MPRKQRVWVPEIVVRTESESAEDATERIL